MKYVTKRTKEEILEIVVDEFKRVQEEYSKDLENGIQKEVNRGKYVAMFRLMKELQIYEY